MTAAGFRALLALAFLALPAAGARALEMDLGAVGEGEALSVAVSGGSVNRIEFPEAVISAFTSNASLDVKIAGSSVLARTSEEAELVALTEKRRLTLLLVPEDGPSRTVVLRAPPEPSPPGEEKERNGERPGARERERTAVGLVLSLLRREPPPEVSAAPRAALGGGLFLSPFASAEDGDFSAEAYVVENGGRREAALPEAALWSGPAVAAVWTEKERLRPGESSRAVVVRTREEAR